MKTRLAAIILFTLSSMVCMASGQQDPVPDPSHIDLAKSAFEHVKRLSETDGGKFWGKPLAGPVLIIDPGSRMIVANQPDSSAALKERDGVWVGAWPANMPIANTAVDWAGQRWTMVMAGAIPIQDDLARDVLLMHECFHRLQPELGLSSDSPPNAHLDDQLGRTWLRLEMRALREALQATGEARKRAATHAVLFRRARHAEPDAQAAAKEESALEANEGLAEYTGVSLSGAPREAIVQYIARELERRDVSQAFTRSFAYATGPALALLLDEYEPAWRDTVAQNPNLAERLAKALNVPAPRHDATTDASSVAGQYDGQTVINEEAAKAQKRQLRLAEIAELYAADRSLRIETGENFNYSFNPNEAETVDGTRVIYKPFSGLGAWGEIEAPSGAMIDFNFPMTLTLPVPLGSTPETVGWKLKLKPGWKLDTPANGPWTLRRD